MIGRVVGYPVAKLVACIFVCNSGVFRIHTIDPGYLAQRWNLAQEMLMFVKERKTAHA